MTIIRFPGGKGPGGQSELIDLAVHLKQRLISFVVAGKLRPLFVESIEENDVDFVDEGDRIEFTDWFIFEWEDVDGSTTIEHFLASNDDLSDREREMLSAWDDGALDDLFRVADLRSGFIELADAFGNIYRTVPTSCHSDELGLEAGNVISTRIIPVADFYVLSGVQKRFGAEGTETLGPDGPRTEGDSETEEELAALLAEEGRLVEDEVDNLLEFDATSFEEGTLARFAREYLDSIFEATEEEAFESEAYALNALVRFTDEVGPDRPSDLRGDDLLEFFALWYPRQWYDLRSESAKSALTAVWRFLRYLDAALGTFIQTEYERDVMPKLYDVPRCVMATFLLEGVTQARDADETMASLIDGTAADVSDIIEGIFDVSDVEGTNVTLSSPPIDPEDDDDTAIDFDVRIPEEVAGLVIVGDFIECIVVEVSGQWSLAGVRAVYPTAAGGFLTRADLA